MTLTKDYVLKITAIHGDTIRCEVILPHAHKGESINLVLDDNARMDKAQFLKTISSIGLYGYLVADQTTGDGKTKYITKLKSIHDKKRVIPAQYLGIDMLFKSDRDSRLLQITDTNTFLNASSGNNKITILATLAKPSKIAINAWNDIHTGLESIRSSLSSSSYTPKLLIGNQNNYETVSARYLRNDNGELDSNATRDYTQSNQTIERYLNTHSHIYAMPAVAIRLSDLSTKAIVNRLLQGNRNGKNVVLERLFTDTTRDNQPLLASGVVTTAFTDTYEYGTNYKLTSSGETLNTILRGLD